MPKFADIGFQRSSGNKLDFFTYEVPTELEKQLQKGHLVKVPFLRGSRNGVVFNVHSNSPDFATKNIGEIVTEHPLLAEWQLELIKWMADYYFCSAHTVLKLFIPQNIFENKAKRKRKRTIEKAPKAASPKTLSKEQKAAFDTILKRKLQHFLIHGVTGAGKTEIYLQLAQTLKKDEQFLLLVPEISLTPQLIEYFQKNFTEEIATIHSRLAVGEKREIWEKIKAGKIRMVVGSRSALFAPFNNLRFIVMDEEQEWSYKQDQSPRYHTRTVAEKVCELLPKCKLVLGSATPSIESYHAAEIGKYELLELPKRINQAAMPNVELVDLRDELKKKNYSIFSDALEVKMAEKLAKNEQILLFLNRRGSASAVVCRDCGESIKCNHCDVSMTYHKAKDKARLICHYCGIIETPPDTCPSCESPYIKFIGVGTQRVEDEVKKLFPKARIHRADRDTTSNKDSFKELYKKLKNHEIDVLIGTQMIGKGLHLPKINLVGVILADIGLHVPDFRSSEKTFQLLTQVAGRAGRIDKGEVIIQSYLPEHPAIALAKEHDYKSFYNYEIKNRRDANYPPYQEIIRLLISDKDKAKCKAEHARILKMLEDRKEKNMEILAHPALIERIHNKYRYVITLKGSAAAKTVSELLPEMSKWKIDRDPYWS